MIEQSKEEIAAAMRSDPCTWAELYMQANAGVYGLSVAKSDRTTIC